MFNIFLNSQIQDNVNQMNKINLKNEKPTNLEKNISEKSNNIYTHKINLLKKSNNTTIPLINNKTNTYNTTNNNNNNNNINNNNKKKLLYNFAVNYGSNIRNMNYEYISDQSINKSNDTDILVTKLNSNIKIINNVYKTNFKNAESSGFGDFIRGCFFLLEFCENNKLIVDFHIYDSNLKVYLKNFINKPNINDNIASEIDRFMLPNYELSNVNGVIGYKNNSTYDDEFMNYLNNTKCYSKNIFINTINFPSNNISKKYVDIMKYILEPINSLKVEINNLLKDLELVEKTFTTYHLRLGDEYLNDQNNNIEESIIDKLLDKITINHYDNYLIISDSVFIKDLLKEKFSNIKILNNSFSHTVNNDIIDIKNTLIDFYLMSFSKQIISFSTYPHGSGFSKWCSITYEIPYICYSLLEC
jgi:hypothetical protein